MLKNIKGITSDSRKVKKNYIFVAVSGRTVDGHKFINKAIKSGASVVVGERKIDIPNGIKYIKVTNSRETLGDLASEFYGFPSKKLKIIGVTGTKGKTTTSYMIYHILNTVGKKAGLISSIEAKIGNRKMDTGFHVTSPEVVDLHAFLKKMVEAKCRFAIVEVSSHGIDQGRIAGVKFDVGVLTNIAPEHLDYHKTFEEYKKVKMSFINSAKHKVIAPKTTDLAIFPGVFNNLDAEAAIKAVGYFGVTRNGAIKALVSFKLPRGRLEEIKNDLGIKIVIDFAHTPESLMAVLQYLKPITKNNLISVFGAAGERDPYKRPRMGEVSGKLSDIVILTSEDPRTEQAQDIIAQIRSGIKSKNVKVYEISDRQLAIQKALELAKSGDTVGIFGKGHEKSMNLDGIHEIPWSDQEIVREYLEEFKK